MKKLYSLLLLFTPCTLISQDYYQGINTNSSVLLRSSLHELINDHNSVSYSACVQHLKSTDEDPNNSNNIISKMEIEPAPTAVERRQGYCLRPFNKNIFELRDQYLSIFEDIGHHDHQSKKKKEKKDGK